MFVRFSILQCPTARTRPIVVGRARGSSGETRAPAGLSMPQQQAVPAWCQLAIAHLEPSAPGAEGQQPAIGCGVPLRSFSCSTQQQHAAAFGIHRVLLRKLPQGGKASAALPQLLSVLLRKTAWQDQSPGVGRYRFIGEGAPEQQASPCAPAARLSRRSGSEKPHPLRRPPATPAR